MTASSRLKKTVRKWVPPAVWGAVQATLSKFRAGGGNSKTMRSLRDDVRFVDESTARAEVLDAFGLIAVCRRPVRTQQLAK